MEPTGASHRYFKVSKAVDVAGVVVVEFARPPVNAFNQSMWEEMSTIFNSLNQDGEVRVVVLASAHPTVWTAGLDLNDVDAIQEVAPDAARRALQLRKHILDFQAAISSIEACRVPVIAAVSGIALGLAVDICCACDIRMAAQNTVFSIKEVDVGMAADIGTLSRAGKLLGNQSALSELAFTARDFRAEEAREIGFVSRVCPGGREEVMDAALKLAKVIAAKSPIAVLGTKHLLLHARDHTVQESLDYTAMWNAAMLQSSDAIEAFGSFKTKKPPVFKNLASKL